MADNFGSFPTPPPPNPLESQPAPPLQPLPAKYTAFYGPNGLRTVWRALLFGVFAVFFTGVFSFVGALLMQRFGGVVPGRASSLTPLGTAVFEGCTLLGALAAALLMTQIERGKFNSYGLPLRFAFGKNFWIGTLSGFAAISACLLGIYAFHGFHLGGIAIHGTILLESTAGWSIAFVTVGLSEEFLFRGYLQYTLTNGIGFWWSALIMSVVFGAAHYGNPGESWSGLVEVVLFGLLFCLFLRRTGNLWWAVGFHAGWDWGQTFFYGVPDSGMPAYHSLFTSAFNGPKWLTGGSVGPEGSVFTVVVLVLVAVVFSRVYRDAVSPDQKVDAATTTGVLATGG